MADADAKELRGGRYVLMGTLGEGTQGETFEAVDKREGRLVAIKRFRVGKAKAWKDVELAEREATTLASLEHDLLPRYVEHFEEDGALVLVMERIQGESLAQLRKKGFRASPADVQRLLADASRALDYLHGRAPPVVHRDLKPGNVIRRPDGSFAFVDFGAVRDRLKPAGGSTVVGTFGYMAPEQFQGRASAASDVYGIGATCLTLLTGEEPENLPHKGLGIDVGAALPKSTPIALVRTLAAMLEPDPDQRASSIREAMARGGATPASVPPPPPPRRAARHEQRHAERDARRAERAERRAKRPRRSWRGLPLLLRLVAWAHLLAAMLVVGLVVGMVAPLVLHLLAFVFGKALTRAANACYRGSKTAVSAMWRAGVALGGSKKAEAEAEARRVRVEDVSRRVRAVTPAEAQEEHMRRIAMDDVDAEEWADRRATEEAMRWEPPEAWAARDEAKRKKATKPGS